MNEKLTKLNQLVSQYERELITASKEEARRLRLKMDAVLRNIELIRI